MLESLRALFDASPELTELPTWVKEVPHPYHIDCVHNPEDPTPLIESMSGCLVANRKRAGRSCRGRFSIDVKNPHTNHPVFPNGLWQFWVEALPLEDSRAA